MKRAVVCVATGRYRGGCERLGQTVRQFGNCDFISWTDPLPSEWPTHEQKPYSFKAWSLMEAAKDHDLLIWADAAVVAIRSMEPLWAKIEKDGWWLAENGWTNAQWTCDSAYADLFPGVPIESARILNGQFTQICATAFGLNLRSEKGKQFLDEYFRLSNTNAFCGPWTNTNRKDQENWKQDPSRMAPCGPPEVIGHRHDQTAASVLAWRLGMKLTQCPSIFAFPPAAEDTILLAVGA